MKQDNAKPICQKLKTADCRNFSDCVEQHIWKSVIISGRLYWTWIAFWKKLLIYIIVLDCFPDNRNSTQNNTFIKGYLKT